jgi:hypothetical protein
MKQNKIENLIKKDGYFIKLFGILSKYAHTFLNFHEKIGLTENYDFNMQKWKKTLLEVEVVKGLAIEFVVKRKTVNYT